MMESRNTDRAIVREFIFGEYRLDVAAYQLWRGDSPITLTPKAFDTLAVLIQYRDRAVSKDELLGTVWPDSSVSEDSLTQSISVLRKALADDPARPMLIATIARRGYRFIAPVIEVEPSSPDAEVSRLGLPEPRSVPGPPPVPRRRKSWVPWAGGALLGGLVVWGLAAMAPLVFSRKAPAPEGAPALRFSITAPEETSIVSGGILSPDGKYMALLAEEKRSGTTQMWLRSMNRGQYRRIAGTEGATRPFWSPDSRFIGFFAGGKLKRVGTEDQTAQAIASAGTNTSGGTWGASGLIVFAHQRSRLYSVPESGGELTPVTNLNSAEQEVAHRWPQFLPDGEHFLYFNESAKPERTGTYLGSLHSKTTDRLLNVPALFAQPGYLVYTRDGLLMAETFDLAHPRSRHSSRVIGGTAFPAGMIDEITLSASNVSVSANGLLAYTSSDGMPQMKWFDRSGRETGAVDMPTPMHSPVLSPDQKQVLAVGRNLEHGVWIVDLPRGVSTRIESDGMGPLWSPDGTRIAFSADRAGASTIFVKPASGTNDTLLLRSPSNKSLDDWSPDGRFLLFTNGSRETKLDLWTLPMEGDQKPSPFLKTPANEVQGQFSPDQHWVAYTSDESGTWEVYLESFPATGREWVVSIGGGAEPHWRKDGKELFYLSAGRNLMAVSITLGASPLIERPHVLFRAPVLSTSNIFRDQYAVSSDGQRFLVGSVDKASKQDPITVLSAWPSLLSH